MCHIFDQLVIFDQLGPTGEVECAGAELGGGGLRGAEGAARAALGVEAELLRVQPRDDGLQPQPLPHVCVCVCARARAYAHVQLHAWARAAGVRDTWGQGWASSPRYGDCCRRPPAPRYRA